MMLLSNNIVDDNAILYAIISPLLSTIPLLHLHIIFVFLFIINHPHSSPLTQNHHPSSWQLSKHPSTFHPPNILYYQISYRYHPRMQISPTERPVWNLPSHSLLISDWNVNIVRHSFDVIVHVPSVCGC